MTSYVRTHHCFLHSHSPNVVDKLFPNSHLPLPTLRHYHMAGFHPVQLAGVCHRVKSAVDSFQNEKPATGNRQCSS